MLPFHTNEERGEDILPWLVATDDSDRQDTLVRDVVAEAVYDLLDAERYGDPDDPLGGALFGPPGERIPALRGTWERLGPWVSMVQVLLDTEDAESESPSEQTTAMVGEQPNQVSLAAAAAGDMAVAD